MSCLVQLNYNKTVKMVGAGGGNNTKGGAKAKFKGSKNKRQFKASSKFFDEKKKSAKDKDN